MVMAILVLLGVPLWVVVGMLAAAVVSRRRFLAQPDVFSLASRAASDASWPRRAARGRLVHDVLVVNSGVALVRTTVRGLTVVRELSRTGADAPFAAVYELTFDDGAVEHVAIDDEGSDRLRSIMVD